jgi:fructokinase
MVSLTRGKKGSSLYTAANSYHQETTSRATVADTVGAGDAYAAVLAVGYVNHWTPERIVKASAKLAERICGIKGAIPKDAEFYKDVRDTLEESV